MECRTVVCCLLVPSKIYAIIHGYSVSRETSRCRVCYTKVRNFSVKIYVITDRYYSITIWLKCVECFVKLSIVIYV